MSITIQEPQTEAPAVTLTPAAIRRVQFLIQKRGGNDLALQIGVKGGGCSGLSYTMTLDANATERDYTLWSRTASEFWSIRKSARFLDGLQLDYTTANLLEGELGLV